ncbi:ABC transporter permease [Conexibacter arvalis]|uniref:ABC-2 type transport system permease protein n=1 Tax=Conexibacter arvalis TaxID=912552 RepID=A0A840IBC5_9ACTN|nr:ABC transporter permease [Conexibacter arvalis]MBB4661240.1 ABC-2 type transport system permease protein [Conexibacter arvalis]
MSPPEIAARGAAPAARASAPGAPAGQAARGAADARSGAAAPAAARAARARARRPRTAAVYKWELLKLRAQKRTYLGLGAAVIVPIIFLAALEAQGSGPDEVPFGRYVTQTGLAIPPVLLLFSSIWLFPLIVSLVAGDIVANEDGNGTLKTILTRSVDRHQIFVAKVLAAFTYAVTALVLFAGTGLLLGCLRYGFDPLVSLSGTTIETGRGLTLLGAALLAYLMPVLAIASIALLLSTVTRNSAAAVVGALMFSLILQIIGLISGLDAIRPYLLSTQFDAWQGLLREPIDWAPIVRSAWVCALYAVPSLIAALLVFMRRDVTGG